MKMPQRTPITVIIVRIEGEPEPMKAPPPVDKTDSESLAITALAITTILCFAGAGLLATLRLIEVVQSWGPVIVAVILAVISAVATATTYLKKSKSRLEQLVASGGKGPYRRYDARPTSTLFTHLGVTVQALRDAANENNWMIDWRKVDELQQRGQEELDANHANQAIRYQSEAIVETMNQLREQHNREASETAVDH